jgi:hypothetical protein
MPAMAWYELKLTGTLSGPSEGNEKLIAQFQDLFPPEPPEPPPSEEAWNELFPWPTGFMLPGYKVVKWLSAADDIPNAQSSRATGGADTVTLLTFLAELLAIYPGTLFLNREVMLKEVGWFYRYCNIEWYMDLKRKLNALNSSFAKSDKLIARVDFRDWKWYCGNGGGD